MKVKKMESGIKKKAGIIAIIIFSMFVASSSLSGCATSQSTAASGTTGAIIGAGTGFVIGALTGGPIGAIIGTAAGASIGYGVGYFTGEYVVTREGGIKGLSFSNVPYRLASNEFIYDPPQGIKINPNEVKGVLISNLKIYTVPRYAEAGKKINLFMKYNVLGSKTSLGNAEINETRILEGLNGKIYYSHSSTTNITEEGYYKTDLTVTLPKKTPKVYIYESIIKVNSVITALSSRLVVVK